MALDTYAIITLADLKATLGITASTDDAQLEQAINAATQAVESYLGRNVKARRYREWTTAYGGSRVVLRHAPVGTVYWLGTGQTAAINASSTVTDDLVASVAILETAMKLTRVTAAGVETVTTLSFATYPSASLLVAAINATTGFAATLQENCPSRYLWRQGGRNLRNATAMLTYAADSIADTQVDADAGIIHLAASAYGDHEVGWPGGDASVLADYEGGWDTVPRDVEAATRLVAAATYYARKRDPTLAAESLGDYSYTLAAPGGDGGSVLSGSADAKALLDPYRRLR